MRFLSFVVDFVCSVHMESEEIITFNGWIHTSDFAKKNPHAGIPQIMMFVKLNYASDTVKEGFIKACLEYQKEPMNMLPKHLKRKADLIEYVNNVHFQTD